MKIFAFAAVVALLPALPAAALSEPVCFMQMSGRTIDLTSMCGDPNLNRVEPAAIAAPLSSELAPVASSGDAEFARVFQNLAVDRPIILAQMGNVSLGELTTFGRQVCTALGYTQSFEPIHEIQVHYNFPTELASAINVASVYAYCPQHQSLL